MNPAQTPFPIGGGLNFDPTISFGTLLSILFVIAAIMVAYIKIQKQLVTLETKINPMWRWFTNRFDQRGRRDRGNEHG